MPHRLEKSVGLFAVASLVVIGGTFLYRWPKMVPPNPYAVPRKLDPIERQIRTGIRQVYPYSVVPGGVFNPIEVIAAAQNDKVVEQHYEGIALDKLAPVVLKQPRTAYVSYRKGDRIYWTRKPVVIRAGEAVLTDGREKIRARCGNRISEVPRLPVADAEPTPDIETPLPSDEVAIVAKAKELLEEAGAPETDEQQLISFAHLPEEQTSGWWPILPGGGGAPIGGGTGGGGGSPGGGAGGAGGGGGDIERPASPNTPSPQPDQPVNTTPGGSNSPDTPGVPSVPPVQPNIPVGTGSDLPGYPPSIPPYIPQVPGPAPTDDTPKPLLNEPGPSPGSGDSTIPVTPGSPGTPVTPQTPGTPQTPVNPHTQDTPDKPTSPTTPGIPKDQPGDNPEDHFRPVPEPRMVLAIAVALAGLIAWRYRGRFKQSLK